MSLIEEIIALATDAGASNSFLLRKCLVLAYRLNNKRLKRWVQKELDGYSPEDALPEYRVAHTFSRGVFFGSYGSKIENQPIPTAVLKPEHRNIVETADLRAPIAAYEVDRNDGSTGTWTIPWSPNLIGIYQAAFYQGDYALASAWQDIPSTFIAALNDTVRNRVLRFALEIEAEAGSSSEDVAHLPAQQIDQTVINIIYGGSNVIAGNMGDVAQGEVATIVKGDVATLSRAVEKLGVDKGDAGMLESAIAA